MSRTFELRVLSGCQAGAHAPMQSEVLIGADLDCDIILADDGLPEPCRVALAADHWTMGGGAPLTFNEPVMFGPVWITVALRDQPWPVVAASDEPGQAAEDAQDDAATHPDSNGSDTKEGDRDSGDRVGVVVSDDDRPAFHDVARLDVERRPGRHYVYAVMLVLGVLMLGLVLAVWRPGVSTARVDVALSEPASRDHSVEQIRQALAELGYADAVQVVVQDDGPLIVRGWVADAVDKDDIARAMTRIWPMPALQIHVENDVLADVGRVVAPDFLYSHVRIRDGQVHIAGVMNDLDLLAGVAERLRVRYPDIAVVTDAVVSGRVMRERFRGLLQDAGMQDVQPEWVGPYLEVDVASLDLKDQDRVHQLAMAFNRDHWERVRLRGRLLYGPGLPFAIRSVVSGPHPYVVLPDGEKILKGGVHQGFRLIAIEAGRLVFSGAQEVVVPR